MGLRRRDLSHDGTMLSTRNEWRIKFAHRGSGIILNGTRTQRLVHATVGRFIRDVVLREECTDVVKEYGARVVGYISRKVRECTPQDGAPPSSPTLSAE